MGLCGRTDDHRDHPAHLSEAADGGDAQAAARNADASPSRHSVITNGCVPSAAHKKKLGPIVVGLGFNSFQTKRKRQTTVIRLAIATTSHLLAFLYSNGTLVSLSLATAWRPSGRQQRCYIRQPICSCESRNNTAFLDYAFFFARKLYRELAHFHTYVKIWTLFMSQQCRSGISCWPH